jgi:predicted nucleic acid-binding protein
MADKFVVDTNVAISANGKDGKGKPAQASLSCQLICIEWLANCKNIDIVLDDTDLIMDEYQKHLSYKGEPNVGDMFFKYLYDYQYTSDRIHRVTITPLNEEKTEFAELPEKCDDPSDRKLLAAAVVAKAILVNATDGDWLKEKPLLEKLQIEVKQLCPEHSCK